MTSWKHAQLAEKVKNVQKGDATKSVNVMETRNFVGQFVSELNLRYFPFDHQSLRIVRLFFTLFLVKLTRQTDNCKSHVNLRVLAHAHTHHASHTA
jgi:hypothetical protein